MKKGILFLVGVFLLVGIALASYFAHELGRAPIKEVTITGVPLDFQPEVQKRIKQELRAGWLNLPLDRVQQALLELPWIDRVEVKRRWPDRLEVNVTRQNWIAYWNDQFLLSHYLDRVSFQKITNIPENLPRWYGPPRSLLKAAYYYELLSEVLSPLQLTIIQLTIAPNGDISLLLGNGIKVQLGQQHVLTRLRHFVKVYPTVFGSQQHLSGDEVDLRYPSGMAVHWSSGGS